MRVWDAVFPAYGLASHKGYCTPEHLRALREFGPRLCTGSASIPCARTPVFCSRVTGNWSSSRRRWLYDASLAGPDVPHNDLPPGAQPPIAARPVYRWYHMLEAAALIAVCTAMGLFLLVFPGAHSGKLILMCCKCPPFRTTGRACTSAAQ